MNLIRVLSATKTSHLKTSWIILAPLVWIRQYIIWKCNLFKHISCFRVIWIFVRMVPEIACEREFPRLYQQWKKQREKNVEGILTKANPWCYLTIPSLPNQTLLSKQVINSTTRLLAGLFGITINPIVSQKVLHLPLYFA